MIPLEAGAYYHIFNRANGNEQLFLSDDNYKFFLKKYQFYIAPICDTLCYCLMPNHFHFLVRIKEDAGESKHISKQFSNLFSSYTQAFNKQQSRMGNLFMRQFKRKKIEADDYLVQLIVYIHLNPVKAGLSKFPYGWNYSSYCSLISNQKTSLSRKITLGYFDGIKNFISVHSKNSMC